MFTGLGMDPGVVVPGTGDTGNRVETKKHFC